LKIGIKAEDDYENDLDFNLEPEPSKTKRVSSRANKVAREEYEDFETMRFKRYYRVLH